MCQLLGMNCNTPTDFCFSFHGFAERAGRTDVHKDGFGVAFYEGRGQRSFHDVCPAADSPIAALIKAYPIKTLNMIAHIRYATCGEVRLQNVHPFTRELWGKYWTWAHNGDLGIATRTAMAESVTPFRAVGETDSEAAFCFILNHLVQRFPGGTPPPPAQLYATVQELCTELTQVQWWRVCHQKTNPERMIVVWRYSGEGAVGFSMARACVGHRNTARQAMDGLWTEVCGQQKQSNDPGNNQHILNTPLIGRR